MLHTDFWVRFDGFESMVFPKPLKKPKKKWSQWLLRAFQHLPLFQKTKHLTSFASSFPTETTLISGFTTTFDGHSWLSKVHQGPKVLQGIPATLSERWYSSVDIGRFLCAVSSTKQDLEAVAAKTISKPFFFIHKKNNGVFWPQKQCVRFLKLVWERGIWVWFTQGC